MRLFAYSLIVVASLDASLAVAQPVERDHRAPVFTPAPASSSGGSIRYRRRPGPRFMLPLKLDIGAAGVATSHGFAPGISAALGVHWASLSPTPTDIDVGLGVFAALMQAPTDNAMPEVSNTVTAAGAYLEIGHTLSSGSFWRTWATGRGEYLGSEAFNRDATGFGGAGRLSAELYLSGVGLEPRGVFVGTYAIGVYAEVGIRGMVQDVGVMHGSAGLTFRTPFVFMP